MRKEEVFLKLTEIFREVFDDDSIEINGETTSGDIEDWDSLEQINLIVAIEKEFSIKFNISEVNRLNNVGEMVEIILERLNNE